MQPRDCHTLNGDLHTHIVNVEADQRSSFLHVGERASGYFLQSVSDDCVWSDEKQGNRENNCEADSNMCQDLNVIVSITS